jgi:hypothetical protein
MFLSFILQHSLFYEFQLIEMGNAVSPVTEEASLRQKSTYYKAKDSSISLCLGPQGCITNLTDFLLYYV